MPPKSISKGYAKHLQYAQHLREGCDIDACPYHWRPWFAWRPVILERNDHRNKPQWAWLRTVMCKRRNIFEPIVGRWMYEEPFIVATFYPER